MPRRVPDPRQAPLPIERALAGDGYDDAEIVAAALVLGRQHVGLDAALRDAAIGAGRSTASCSCSGPSHLCAVVTPALLERVHAALLAENLAIDLDLQTISALAPAVPRGAIEYRARVCWGEGAMLAAETHEPAPAGAPRSPAIIRDVNGNALYLYRSPPPVAIVRGKISRDDAAVERAREFLISAIERGTITRDNPHPREDNGHGQQER